MQARDKKPNACVWFFFALRAPKIQKFRNSEIQKFRNSEIQKFRNSEIQKFRNSEIQKIGSALLGLADNSEPKSKSMHLSIRVGVPGEGVLEGG